MSYSELFNLACLFGSSESSFSLLVHLGPRGYTVYCDVEHIPWANHVQQCLENRGSYLNMNYFILHENSSSRKKIKSQYK